MSAKIYQPDKTAMQSGMAKTKSWILEFDAETARSKDPLMGWNSVSETKTQVKLRFETLDEAKAYAETNGIAYRVLKPHSRKNVSKSYAENFSYDRQISWTH